MKLTLEQYLLLEIGEVEVKEGKDGELIVELVNPDIEKFLKYVKYDERIPEGFEWIKKYITLKPIKNYGKDLGKSIHILPYFKQPIELMLKPDQEPDRYKDEVFRIYPVDPILLVSNKARFIRLDSKKNNEKGKVVVTSNIEEKGKTIEVKFKELNVSYNNDIKSYPLVNYRDTAYTIRAHRIVGITWLADNVNTVHKYIIDHIDNNKHNFKPENLVWVSQSENKSKNNHTTILDSDDEKYLLKRVNDQIGLTFKSIEDVAKYFKLTDSEKEALLNKKLPTTIRYGNEVYVLVKTDDYKNNLISSIVNRNEYRYKLFDKNRGKILLFRNIEEILKKYGLSEYKLSNGYKRPLFEGLKEHFEKQNMELDFIGKHKIYNQNTTDKYRIEAKNLETNEIISEYSTKKMAERLGVSKSAVISRLNGNPREGKPLIDKHGNQWLIRRSDMPFPPVRNLETGLRLPVLIIKDDYIEKYESLRKASIGTGISRDKLKSMAKIENGYYVIRL